MSKLTIEQLNKVKKFADDLGFKSYIGYEETHAAFSASAGIADVEVLYDSDGIGGRPEIAINWSNCDGGKASVTATESFIKFMGYARDIATMMKLML